MYKSTESMRVAGGDKSRPMICGGFVVAASLFSNTPALAQYPTRPIRMVVPYGAGSSNDTVARLISTPLAEALGRAVVIDNRPGASGNIGAELAANSPPDGHTLMVANAALAVNVSLYRKLNYDLVKDFAPVSWLAYNAYVIVVHPSVPAKSVKELIEFARARPGQVNAALSSSVAHLLSEQFQSLAKIKLAHIQYRSNPQVVTALLSGEGAVAFPSLGIALPFVQSAKLRALGVTSAQRSRTAPDIPTVAEAGLPGYEASAWYGLMVPAKTSLEIVSRLSAESTKALHRADVKERLLASDFEVVGAGPEQFGAHIRSEIVKWGKLAKAAGLRPE